MESLRLIRQNSLVVAGLVVILPAALFGLLTLLYQITYFFNPCVSFGTYGAPSVIGPLSESLGGCSSFTRISETIPQAITGLFIIQGGVIFAVVLGIAGIVYSRRNLLLPAFAILIVESILLLTDGLFIVILPPGIFFLWAAIRRNSRQPPKRTYPETMGKI